MFALELVGSRPQGAQPYYSVVVRDPYIIGRLTNSDIVLDAQHVSRQHATLAVSLTSEASNLPGGAVGASNNNDAANGRSSVQEPQREADKIEEIPPEPLTLSLTNYSKFGTLMNGKVISGCCSVPSGGIVSFGENLSVRCTYRPIVVCVSCQYIPEYITEVRQMLVQLGATVVDDPLPITPLMTGTKAAPIAAFHCAEMIDDDAQCLAAMALGYSIVCPACVFELFAALAGAPGMPLHSLPNPAEFEPKKNVSVYGSLEYLRPEGSTCPFALYPAPHFPPTRVRKMLMWRRRFVIPDSTLAAKIGPALTHCGGKMASMGEGFERTLSAASARNYFVVPHAEFESLRDMDGMYPQDIVDAFDADLLVISDHCIVQGLLTGMFAPTTLRPPRELEVASVATGETGATSEAPVILAARAIPREDDPDRTPSELSEEPSEIDQEGNEEVIEEYISLEKDLRTRVFVTHFERVKNTMNRAIIPSIAKVESIVQAARRHCYITASSISFLHTIFDRCARHLAALEHITTSPEGNNHAMVLREQWDLCVSLQKNIQEALEIGAKINGKGIVSTEAFSPHYVPPREITEPEPQAQNEPSPRQPKRISGSPEKIPECTRLARYSPPAPTKAYLPFAPRPKKTEKTKVPPAHGPLPPQDVIAIAKRHSEFAKFYGLQEGEIRFGMWMNGQSIDWINAFYAAIDERGLSMQEVMDLVK